MDISQQLRALGVHPSWDSAFLPVADQLGEVLQRIEHERSSYTVLPAAPQMLRVFQQPVNTVRVIVLGQDPYPTPGHAVGLAFSVAATVQPLPGSLRNIFKELHSDVGVVPPQSGDLSAWEAQGVLLLNTALTVRAGAAGSHAKIGWEPVIRAVLQFLQQQHAAGQPLVALLWGKHAQRFAAELSGVPQVSGVHPSPLSAARGFFGSKPFSAVNRELQAQHTAAINWQLNAGTLF